MTMHRSIRRVLPALVVLLAPVASDAQLDRPDLANVAVSTAFVDQTADGSNYAFLNLSAYAGNNRPTRLVAVMGRVRDKAGVGTGTMGFLLHEPDKIIRKKWAQLFSQSRYVAASFSARTASTVFTGYFYASTSAASDCKAIVKVVDKDRNGSLETTIWSAKCRKGALNALGLTESQRTALKRIFGSAKVLKLKGRAP
jgi:hypothetical protein